MMLKFPVTSTVLGLGNVLVYSLHKIWSWTSNFHVQEACMESCMTQRDLRNATYTHTINASREQGHCEIAVTEDAKQLAR
jgi:hypothetical protein